jgi:hypothetical protein
MTDFPLGVAAKLASQSVPLTAITRNGPAFTLSYDHDGNLACKIGQNTGATIFMCSAGDSLVAT